MGYWVSIEWICSAIYINEHLNATNIISGDLTWMNKSQCYWIFCLTSAMCATNLTYVVTRALSFFTLPISDRIVLLFFLPSYFDLFIAFLRSCIRFLAHLWLLHFHIFALLTLNVQSYSLSAHRCGKLDNKINVKAWFL